MREPRGTILGALLLAAVGSAAVAGDGPVNDDRLGLADLPPYAAALAGRPTADSARPSDPTAAVGFRDLWDRPAAFLGRRVKIRGRLVRTFRQGPVGRFPPLAESWVFSEAGDPICIVYPRPVGDNHDRPGLAVQFTGTYLRTVRYDAVDGDRLAPLVVGDRPPSPDPSPAVARPSRAHNSPGGAGAVRSPNRDPGPRSAGEPVLALILSALAAMLIASRSIRVAQHRRRYARNRPLQASDLPDPPLRFVDSPVDDA